jgi:hypothetical protein
MATAAAAAAAAVAATTVPGAVDIAPPPPPPAVNGGGGAEDLSVVDRRNTTQRIHSLEEEAKSGEIVWVKNRMKLIRGDWAWSLAHVQIASGFLKSTTNGRLFAYRDDNAMLQCSTTFPQKWDEVPRYETLPFPSIISSSKPQYSFPMFLL